MEGFYAASLSRILSMLLSLHSSNRGTGGDGLCRGVYSCPCATLGGMPRSDRTSSSRGPHRADQIHSGDPYELSNGQRIRCFPTGERGAQANLVGGTVLETDPAVDSAGVDAGVSTSPGMLRAPDVAVGNLSDKPGWASQAPPLAVEYADTGQDEAQLKARIRDLFEAGTRLIWVVRLNGPRRLEIHQPGRAMCLAHPGEELQAPGILKNPVLVEALYDRQAAHQATLRNLLQRQGYESLQAVKNEGKAEGRAEVFAEGRVEGKAEGKAEGLAQGWREAILGILAARGLRVSPENHDILNSCNDPEQLANWLGKASKAASADEILES